MFIRLLLPLLALANLLPAQSDGNDPFPPHRIADKLYYVGSKGLSTYLITTSKGHILINSSFERTVPIIRANVEQLGFKFNDVKILLASHAHSDHVEGHSLIKELTGASVYVMEGDDQVIANGGAGQYLYDARWKPCKIDRVLKDGSQVTLGEATLTARRTPGHKRGCTTWTMQAKDPGKTYNVVFIGSPNVNPGYRLVGNPGYPEISEDFARTVRLLKSCPATSISAPTATIMIWSPSTPGSRGARRPTLLSTPVDTGPASRTGKSSTCGLWRSRGADTEISRDSTQIGDGTL